jgi:hypothetical protein
MSIVDAAAHYDKTIATAKGETPAGQQKLQLGDTKLQQQQNALNFQKGMLALFPDLAPPQGAQPGATQPAPQPGAVQPRPAPMPTPGAPAKPQSKGAPGKERKVVINVPNPSGGTKQVEITESQFKELQEQDTLAKAQKLYSDPKVLGSLAIDTYNATGKRLNSQDVIKLIRGVRAGDKEALKQVHETQTILAKRRQQTEMERMGQFQEIQLQRQLGEIGNDSNWVIP